MNTCCRFLISSGSAFPVLFFFSHCTFLMTIFCYSFRLVQFQFSTTDCYLNDSIPFCSFVCGPFSSSGHERIFYCILNIFSIIFEQLLCCRCQRCEIVLCYSSLICPFSTWSICRYASKWKLKCLSFDCLHIRMCATPNAKCLLYEPLRFHIIPSIMCCLLWWFPNDLTFSSSSNNYRNWRYFKHKKYLKVMIIRLKMILQINHRSYV